MERTLTAVGADTAASILASAREAQSSLTATSADAASQIKAIATDIERSLSAVTANTTDNIQTSALNAQSALVAASNEVSSKVKSTSAEVERTVLAASGSFGSTMTGKTDEIVTYVQQQADRLSQMIDGKRGTLVEALGSKSNQLTIDIDRVTSDALKSIETRGQAFSQSMMTNGSDVARTITSAGELATGAVTKSLKELEQSSRAAIDQSRQVSIAAVTEMQETSKILRTDTVALFERLREGNILLQEVLTGAHDNLNSLERALVTRVADFVSAMNDVTSRNGVATQTLEDQLTVFNTKTSKALQDLGSLSSQFDSTARLWSRPRPWSSRATAAPRPPSPSANRRWNCWSPPSTCAPPISINGCRASPVCWMNCWRPPKSAPAISPGWLRKPPARVLPLSAGSSRRSGFAEEERRLTAETMSELYQQGTQEADAMFKQSADKFADDGGEHEADGFGNASRTRCHPQRAAPRRAGNAAGGRRKHRADAQGDRRPDRGVGRTEPDRRPSRPRPRRGLAGRASAQREEEPMLVAAVSNRAPRRAGWQRQRIDPAAAGPRRPRPAPHRSAAGQPRQFRPGTRRLAVRPVEPHRCRAAHPAARRPPVQPAASDNPLASLSLDIGRLMDRNLAAEMWDRYQRGESKAFTKRLYTPAGQKAFDEVARKYRADRGFKQTVDRYITEFERLLDEVARDERGPAMLRSHLTSETGLVYTLLAHAAGRLG